MTTLQVTLASPSIDILLPDWYSKIGADSNNTFGVWDLATGNIGPLNLTGKLPILSVALSEIPTSI